MNIPPFNLYLAIYYFYYINIALIIFIDLKVLAGYYLN